jgi:hypothetical protein
MSAALEAPRPSLADDLALRCTWQDALSTIVQKNHAF